jgi:hypothetical protein
MAPGAGETFPGRYFRTASPYSLVNWRWSDDFIYKLFPDVLGFYLFVFTVVLVSALAHNFPSVRERLHRRVWVSGKKRLFFDYFFWSPFFRRFCDFPDLQTAYCSGARRETFEENASLASVCSWVVPWRSSPLDFLPRIPRFLDVLLVDYLYLHRRKAQALW